MNLHYLLEIFLMYLRYYNSSDYNTLCNWWEKHKHPIISMDALPHGIVVEKENNLIAMSFVYIMSGCNVAQIAWTTTNPNERLKDRYNAVNLCLDASILHAKKMNKNLIVCFSGHKSITKLLNKKGLFSGKSHDICMGVLTWHQP